MTNDPIELARSAAPQGWHYDPQRPGWMRYWNGSEWTEQWRPAPQEGPAPPPPVSEAAASLSPADWHRDPQHPGYIRYWDGTRWTEDRSAIPGARAQDDSGLVSAGWVCAIFIPIVGLVLGNHPHLAK